MKLLAKIGFLFTLFLVLQSYQTYYIDINPKDIVTNGDDISESPISKRDGSGEKVILCPSTGAPCRFVLQTGPNDYTFVVGKKGQGFPDVVVITVN